MSTSRPILLGCFEPPSFGGASTSAYQLFKSLDQEFETRYLTLVQQDTVQSLRPYLGEGMLNPDSLGDVSSCVLNEPPFGPQRELQLMIDEIDPALLVGIGYIAAYILKKARPDLPLILITTGCEQVKNALRDGTASSVQELLTGRAAARVTNAIESAAFSQAEVVITHSDLIRRICEIYFPEHRPRLLDDVLWFYDWIHGAATRNPTAGQDFQTRDIDILFIASDWSRVEKNYPLVKALAKQYENRSIHIIGLADDPIETATHHGLLPHREVLEILGRARVLVCPSLFDAAPGVLFEGAAMGCNLVASKNCGNHDVCHPELVANACTLDAFASCIDRALSLTLPANTRRFQEAHGLQRLIGVLERYRPRRLSPAEAEV